MVESDDDVGEHEAEVRHAENVDLVAGHALEARRRLVAHVADGAAHEQRQARHARDLAGAELAGDHAQRVLGVLTGDAAVLDDDLVAAGADDLAVAHAEEAVAAEALSADDALEQERVLGALGKRHERADRRGEVRVDLARHGDHIVVGGESHELFSARQYHLRSRSPSVAISSTSPRADRYLRENKKPPSSKGREFTLAVPPLLTRHSRDVPTLV